jgi:predicted alpha/beta superfamily hydrolase
MKPIKILQIFVVLNLFILNNIFAQSIPEIKKTQPLSIGETVEIYSTILEESRVLNIYLPYGYSADSLKKYPVIYLLDGSMYEDFIHIAGLVQFASFPWINLIPESIVVGISNVDRKRDFTFHTEDKDLIKEFPTAGFSAAFIGFLENELQPFVENNYNTDTLNILIGQSIGGLLATEILFKKPDLFDNYIIVSPSMWWNNESLMKFKPKSYHTLKSIYIAVGKEDEIMVREAEELYDKIKLISSENTRIYFQYFPDQNHGDVLHLAVYDAFEMMSISKKE